MRAYRAENPRYPHELTAEQFFTEAQFEAYRSLGYQIAYELFADEQALTVAAGISYCSRQTEAYLCAIHVIEVRYLQLTLVSNIRAICNL